MKVLCVSPRFAPVNAADSHRLRLLLPHLVALGCEVEVLAVDPQDVAGPRDEWLLQRLPAGLRVHRVRAPRRGGPRGLEFRAWWPLRRAGDALLRGGRYDLVFFSTTDFLLHLLGPSWHSRWGVPFCMDYQDPWVSDYYTRHPAVEPPGGRLRYALKSRIDALAERRVARGCGGFLSVSPAYLDDLRRRYGELIAQRPSLVAAFPGEPDERAGAGASGMPAGSAPGRPQLWRYVGRGGGDMAVAANAFFQAWSLALQQGRLAAADVRFEAIGTSYAQGAAMPTLRPLSVEAGLGDQVSEDTARIGYADMLATLAGSDALVVFGSNDAAYTASKIYPYVLSGRPVLAIFHERSPVVPLIRSAGGAVLVTFDEATSPQALRDRVLQAWFAAGAAHRQVALDRVAFEPYTARAQAHEVLGWWKEVVAHARA